MANNRKVGAAECIAAYSALLAAKAHGSRFSIRDRTKHYERLKAAYLARGGRALWEER